MKRHITIEQAKEHNFNHLVEVVLSEELANDYKREFEITGNPDHWWRGVAEVITIEKMIELLEENGSRTIEMFKMTNNIWRTSVNNTITVIKKELCDALWKLIVEEML